MFNKKIKLVLKIDGMQCEHCAKKVENALMSLNGVTKVKVNLSQHEVIVISFERLEEDVINKLIIDLGYQLIDIKSK